MVPSSSQIVRVWKHFQICKARRVLIIPLWNGAVSVWPCLCPSGVHLAKCVTDWIKSRTYNSMFHGQSLSFKLIAVYVNWHNFHKRRSDRGLCLSAKGLCDDCLKSLSFLLRCPQVAYYAIPQVAYYVSSQVAYYAIPQVAYYVSPQVAYYASQQVAYYVSPQVAYYFSPQVAYC